MLRRLFLTFALALLFGLGQQAALVHEISHYADITPLSQQQDKVPHSQVCEKCLGYAGMAGALGVSHFAPPILAASSTPFTYSTNHHYSPTLAPYSARAPPVLA